MKRLPMITWKWCQLSSLLVFVNCQAKRLLSLSREWESSNVWFGRKENISRVHWVTVTQSCHCCHGSAYLIKAVLDINMGLEVYVVVFNSFEYCRFYPNRYISDINWHCWGWLGPMVTDMNLIQFTKSASAGVLKTTQLLVKNCNSRMQLS